MKITEITTVKQQIATKIRLAAYCRVSSDSTDQLHSFAAQIRYYSDYTKKHPEYELVDIYADEGITGTEMKKRDELNRLIRDCKKGLIDRIIVKSVSRFARNTEELLVTLRMLTDLPFHYKNFLGYRKGADGKPEIDPEEAETIRFIYERFLAGDSLSGIAQKLNDLQVPTPSGKGLWQNSTIQSILSNEKYKGDAIINKTYIKDCLSKKVMVNNGERPKYYVENNHPAIIDAVTFGRVQEELARRSGKPKTKQVGTKTEQGKYSSKYAMTELLVCGECKTPYRRCTWTVKGQKKIVWRCINRLDFGKKYCHNSPTVEESILQRAVMRAIMETAQQNLGVLQTLKVHIGMGLQSEQTEDNSMELQIRIAEIDAEFKAMLAKISTDTVDAFDEEKAKRLMDEKAHLQQQLGNIRDGQLKREQTQSRLDDIYTILDGLKNRPMEYDEQIVRQLLECITVDSKEQITVIFVGGLKVVQPLID